MHQSYANSWQSRDRSGGRGPPRDTTLVSLSVPAAQLAQVLNDSASSGVRPDRRPAVASCREQSESFPNVDSITHSTRCMSADCTTGFGIHSIVKLHQILKLHPGDTGGVARPAPARHQHPEARCEQFRDSGFDSLPEASQFGFMPRSSLIASSQSCSVKSSRMGTASCQRNSVE